MRMTFLSALIAFSLTGSVLAAPPSRSNDAAAIDFKPYAQSVQDKVYATNVRSGLPLGTVVLVSYSIYKDGKIGGLSITHSSGNTDLDQKVKSAILGVQPFSPLPPGSPDSVAVRMKIANGHTKLFLGTLPASSAEYMPKTRSVIETGVQDIVITATFPVTKAR